MGIVRFVTGIARGLFVFAIVVAYVCSYAARRLGTLSIPDEAARRRALARLEGRTLRSAMTRLGACFVKLGQVMSSRPDLFDPELIDELKQLQDRLPPFRFALVREIIESDHGAALSSIFREIDETPVAAASVAQVHRARLLDGCEVAVKVLRPNVRSQVMRDGALLRFGARLLALHPVIRLSDPVGFTREFVAGLELQTDLRVEADNYALFRHNFRTAKRVAFPEVHRALCSERVLVMEFVRGTKLDALPPGDHSEVAEALRGATLQMVFVDGFMHADMHPGNMVLRDDGVLVLFDVGLVTKLRPEILEMFVDLMKCIAMGTPDDTIAHLKRYHVYMGKVDWDAMRKDFEAFALKFRGQNVTALDYGAMTSDVLAIARRYHVHPVPELALVVVGIITFQGLGKMLAPNANDFMAMSQYLIPVLMRAGQKVPDTEEARSARQAASMSQPASL